MIQQDIERIERRKTIEEYGKFLTFNGHFSTHCKRCGRILKSKYSIKRGYGYKCHKKVQHALNMNQMDWAGRELAFKTAYELLQIELKDKEMDISQHE